MENPQILDLTPENFLDYGVCGYKNAKKHKELQDKADWFKRYYVKGLRIKIALPEEGRYQGMLEYIPGRYAHRPVEADGYMFIHCIWVGFKKEYKHRGYGQALIASCIEEAQRQKMKGVAVVTRKGSFMAGDGIFLKMGFQVVDEAAEDFHLLALKFDPEAQDPKFRSPSPEILEKYAKGLVILRSPQCPYTGKNVDAIILAAKEIGGLDVQAYILDEAEKAQDSPCPFGTFCLLYEGKILSYHPISRTRFLTLMQEHITKEKVSEKL